MTISIPKSSETNYAYSIHNKYYWTKSRKRIGTFSETGKTVTQNILNGMLNQNVVYLGIVQGKTKINKGKLMRQPTRELFHKYTLVSY